MHIWSIGTALPPYRVSQEDSARFAQARCGQGLRQQQWLARIYQRAGVQQRHSVVLCREDGPLEQRQQFFPLPENGHGRGPTIRQRMLLYERHAPELATEACRRALQRAELAPDQITHLVTVSCSGFSAPGWDCQVIHRLGLSTQVARTHVGFMGCHGALNGLRVAGAFTRSDPRARVLLCALELCTIHHAYGWDPQRVVANALFADGAAALVGASAHRTNAPGWRLAASGSVLIPETEEAMTWRIGDHGFQMTLAPEVPQLIQQHLRPWLTGWLASQGLQLEQIGSWAVHPGGPHILRACQQALGLSAEQLAPCYEVLARCGNMSSPTLLFILECLWKQKAPAPVLGLAFGPGLTVEAALWLEERPEV